MTIRFLFCLLILCVLVLPFVARTRVYAQRPGKTDSLSRDRLKKLPAPAVESESKITSVAAESQSSTNGSTAQATSSTNRLSARQKFKYGLRQAFFTPGAYLGPAFGAYLTERAEVKAPGKTSGDKFADGLSRFAISFATNSTAQMLGYGVYPVIFKQDPRYKPSQRHGFGARALYAAGRTVLRQGDNDNTQINFSGLAGNLTSAGLANIYERDRVSARDARGRVLSLNRHVGVGPTLISFGISEALEAVSHIALDEFNVPGKVRKLFGKH
jgi:hypothetical protein